ncbi:hypothetical protein PHISP_04225 [Aspergillus sp. HF37]|nr:hypothetical protein PHISP_04225 [Aspergillus sp. HF37]
MAVLQRSNGPSESTSNQIIIGVVVGGFVLIVLTAGVILCVRFRKRKDHDPRKHERQLLPIYIPPAYKTQSLEYPNSFSFSASLSRQSDTHPQPDQPPAYQASLPTYDPSRYQRVDRPLSTMEIGQNSLGPTPPNPVHYAAPTRSHQALAVDNRFSFQRSEGTEAVGRPSVSTITSNPAVHTGQDQPQPQPLLGSTVRGERPRKPRPALSLITNL